MHGSLNIVPEREKYTVLLGKLQYPLLPVVEKQSF
jgi:hypothetical protein